MEDLADGHQGFGIDPTPIINNIDIVPMTAQLLGKPRDTNAVVLHLPLDQFANMQFLIHSILRCVLQK